jgi:two-component system response regulator AtoC
LILVGQLTRPEALQQSMQPYESAWAVSSALRTIKGVNTNLLLRHDRYHGLMSTKPEGNDPPVAGSHSILVIDDEEGLRHLLRLILERRGYRVVDAADGAAGLEALERHPEVRIVLCDIRMPNLDGLGFLDAVAGRDLYVVMMSAFGTTETAVESLTRGAYDYIGKPFKPDEIHHCVARVLEREELATQNRVLRDQVVARGDIPGFVGESELAHQLSEQIRRVAAYPTTVLITGESGTGKEVVARSLHQLSDRSSAPFVAVNCAAIPENLLESELFGHEKGAFTGAAQARAGLFEQAHGGTLLLDEIGDMPTALQSRLLRVLEDSRVRRLGGNKDIDVDVRVIAATAQPLEQAVEEKRFRDDLFYRLNVVRLRVPALRDRRSDIPLLADAFMRQIAARYGKPLSGIDDDALRVLSSHPWPGNIRQLLNAVERAVLMAVGDTIAAADLPQEIRDVRSTVATLAPDLGDSLSIKAHSAALERRLIVAALEQTKGNRTQAAKLLEISYKALAYKIRDYGIET